MSGVYEEILEGERLLRHPPGERHEAICARLHAALANALAGSGTSRLMAVRSVVQFSPGTLLRPDLTLLTVATGRPWLVVEVVSAGDHQPDTVVKKDCYERVRVPRLWVIDPRYDNVEVYNGGPYGLALRSILAQRDVLTDQLLPGFAFKIFELFGVPNPDAARR